MKQRIWIATVLASLLTQSVYGFCGFYVAKADAQLFNQASQVVLVRQEDKTVLTMSNDYKGELKEFAVVIPVPTFIKKNQIHITEKQYIDHLDAYTAPRLVEYYDSDPCDIRRYMEAAPSPAADGLEQKKTKTRNGGYGVTIEAQYTVGEYDILILSAKESDGLENWLQDNDYRIPQGANRVLDSYIKQNMRFFVAKVNLTEQTKLGFTYLRPIQVAYEHAKFMLPIRLGTVNSQGTQELFVYTLTQKGRVETTNYRTIKLPTDVNLPVYIKGDFANFYKALFDNQVKQEKMKTVFLEYAWDMNWCDPCAADPLSNKELREFGVFWVPKDTPDYGNSPKEVFVTRLHVRYDAAHFPEDLVFQETSDRENYQGRYILQHPWQGTASCPEAEEYFKNLPQRFEQEAKTLSSLTGWKLADIREKMALKTPQEEDKNWWEKLWE